MRQSTRFILVLLALGAVSSCSCDVEERDGVSPRAFCIARERGRCQREASCTGTDASTCAATAQQRCERSDDTPTDDITPGAVLACEEAWAQLTCEQLQAGVVPDACQGEAAGTISAQQQCEQQVTATCERMNACFGSETDCASAAELACRDAAGGRPVDAALHQSCLDAIGAQDCASIEAGERPAACVASGGGTVGPDGGSGEGAGLDGRGPSQRQWCEGVTLARCERQAGGACGGGLTDARCREIASQACAGLSDVPAGSTWLELYTCIEDTAAQACGATTEPSSCGAAAGEDAPDTGVSNTERCQTTAEAACERANACNGASLDCATAATRLCEREGRGGSGMSAAELDACEAALAGQACDATGATPAACRVGLGAPYGVTEQQWCEQAVLGRCANEGDAACGGSMDEAACGELAERTCTGLNDVPTAVAYGQLFDCAADLAALPCGDGSTPQSCTGRPSSTLTNQEWCQAVEELACYAAARCGGGDEDACPARAQASCANTPDPQGASPVQSGAASACQEALFEATCAAVAQGLPQACTDAGGAQGPGGIPRDELCRTLYARSCERAASCAVPPGDAPSCATDAGIVCQDAGTGPSGWPQADVDACAAQLATGCGVPGNANCWGSWTPDGPPGPGVGSGGNEQGGGGAGAGSTPDGDLTREDWCRVVNTVLCDRREACAEQDGADCAEEAAAQCRGIPNADQPAGLADGAVTACIESGAVYACADLTAGGVPFECTAEGGAAGPGGLDRRDVCERLVEARCDQAAVCGNGNPNTCTGEAQAVCLAVPNGPSGATASDLAACLAAIGAQDCNSGSLAACWGPWTPWGPPDPQIGNEGFGPVGTGGGGGSLPQEGADEGVPNLERCTSIVTAACDRSNECSSPPVDCSAAATRLCLREGDGGSGMTSEQLSACQTAIAGQGCAALGGVPTECQIGVGAPFGVSEQQWCEETVRARCERQGGDGCGGGMDALACAEFAARTCAGLNDLPSGVSYAQLFDCASDLGAMACGDTSTPQSCTGGPGSTLTNQEWCELVEELACYAAAECGLTDEDACPARAEAACADVADPQGSSGVQSGGASSCQEALFGSNCDTLAAGTRPRQCSLEGGQQGPGGVPRDDLCEALYVQSCTRAARCAQPPGDAAACAAEAAAICAGVGAGPSGWSQEAIDGCAAQQAGACGALPAAACWGPWSPNGPPGPGVGSGGNNPGGGQNPNLGTTPGGIGDVGGGVSGDFGDLTGGANGDSGTQGCIEMQTAVCQHDMTCAGNVPNNCTQQAILICTATPTGESDGPASDSLAECVNDVNQAPCVPGGTNIGNLPVSCTQEAGADGGGDGNGGPDGSDDNTPLSYRGYCQLQHDIVCSEMGSCGANNGCSGWRNRHCSPQPTDPEEGTVYGQLYDCQAALAPLSCGQLEGGVYPSDCQQFIGQAMYATEQDWCIFVNKTVCEQIDRRCGLEMPDDFRWNYGMWGWWWDENSSCDDIAARICSYDTSWNSTERMTCATSVNYQPCIEAALAQQCSYDDGEGGSTPRGYHQVPSECRSTMPWWGTFRDSRGWCRDVNRTRCLKMTSCENAPQDLCNRPEIGRVCDIVEQVPICVTPAMGTACLNAITNQSCDSDLTNIPVECRTFPLRP